MKDTAEPLDKLIPHVCITSYLPKDPGKREKRMEFHLRQRAELDVAFSGLYVLSICSGYTDKEAKRMKGFPCHFHEERIRRWKKYNMVLSKLYEYENGLSTVLFM